MAVYLVLGGCSLFSKPKGMALVDSFKPGVTTMKQTTAVLGRPQSVQSQPNGSIVLGWLNNTEGPAGPATEGVTISFDANGKMIQVLQRYENILGY